MKEIGFYQPCHKKQYNGTTTDKRLPDLFSVLLPNHRHQIQVDKQVTERGKVMTENTAEGRQKQYRPQGLTVQPLPQEISGQSWTVTPNTVQEYILLFTLIFIIAGVRLTMII